MQKPNKILIIKLMFLIVHFLNILSLAQEIKITYKKNNYLREGPAVYYNLIDILSAGTNVQILEIKGKWSRVKTGKVQIGWLSNKSFEKTQSSVNISELAKKWASKKVAKISLAGAIKGLLGKVGETEEGDFDRLLQLSKNDISDFKINNFTKGLRIHNSENRGKVDFDDANLIIPEFDPSFQEQQIGFGIASRLVRKPVINNPKIKNYIYSIVYALLNESEFYDYEFNIFLLKEKNPDGYSCPGGFIFITTGIFNVCTDEAELAAAIAHEIGHQIMQHGAKELGERMVQIKSEEFFAEMDNEINNGELNKTEKDLNSMIANAYERVVNYRTLTYELEADKVAAILLANAGYDPFAIVRLTERLAKLYVAEKDIFSDNYLSPNDMQTRYEKILEFANDNFENEEPGVRLKIRFNNNYKVLFK